MHENRPTRHHRPWQYGNEGFLSLEPHLAAGQFAGFSGPELFSIAVNAFKKIACDNQLDC
jgi:hypothetical protein